MTPITNNAAFVAESEKQTRLRGEAGKREIALREIEQRIHALLTRDDTDEIDRHALALVRGDQAEPVEGLQSLNARAADLRREIIAYRRAMTIQRAVIADLRADLSVDAAEVARPAHRAAVAKMLAAVQALRDAAAKESAARMGLQEAGYDQRLPEHRSPIKLDAADMQIANWERNARSYAG